MPKGYRCARRSFVSGSTRRASDALHARSNVMAHGHVKTGGPAGVFTADPDSGYPPGAPVGRATAPSWHGALPLTTQHVSRTECRACIHLWYHSQ